MDRNIRLLWWVLLAFLLFCAWIVARGGPTQGAGAKALLRGIKQAKSPTMPKAIVLPPKPAAIYYFTATAHDANGLESDFSNECRFTNSAKLSTVALAWDRSTGSNVTGYTVHKGRAPGQYTNSYPAGTNLTLRVPLAPPPLTNVLVTVTGPGTNWSATNPTGMRLWKGLNLSISARMF